MKARKKSQRVDKELQELCQLGILEPFTDYRIKESYLNDFLTGIEKNYGKRDYIVGSQLVPLFDRIKQKLPDASEDEVIAKAHTLIPIIRAIFHRDKIIHTIKRSIKEGDDNAKIQ